MSSHQLNSKTNDSDIVLLLKTIEGTETVPCRLLLWMAWMEMD